MGRHDCDGIELDFNRFPAFFGPVATEERVAKMNSLVQRVRAMLEDLGLPLRGQHGLSTR